MRWGALAILTVAAASIAGGAALAADQPRAATQRPVLVRADELQYDQELGLTVAKGHVELDQGDQILLADTVTYNQKEDMVTGSGNVALLQPSGDVLFADFIELHDEMRDGFIKDIRLLLSDGSRLAGNTARRVDGVRTDIRRAVYSPCELCQSDPRRPPVWQIKAEEVVHDKELEIVEYRDAVMEIDGIPVMYSPYFSHPDPSVKRASGFLAPTFGTGNNLGFHTTIPYFWAIAPDRDFTFRPMITSGAGVVLDGEYRQRFANGLTVDDASIEAGGAPTTISASGFGPRTGPARWDLYDTGVWDLTDSWRAGYQVERESDQTYLLRYQIRTPTNSFTTLPAPSNYLPTHFYAENFGADHYGTVSADAFQSLNPAFGNAVEPIALPQASYEWWGDPDALGGHWQLLGSALDLLHDTGPEVRRLSTGAAWRLPFNGALADKFDFTASVRADGYSSDHVPLTPNLVTVTNQFGQTVELPSNVNTVSAFAGRSFPQVSLRWRDPWVRADSGGNAVIEPEAALIAAPKGLNPPQIPNEDSQGFEFDDMSLFVPNRLPGYDRVDSGQRVDYGLHGQLLGSAYGDWETLVGQSYAFQQNPIFLPGSGLNTRLSDIVGRVVLRPDQMLDLSYRFRLDKTDFAPRRQEVSAKAGPDSLKVSLTFIDYRPIFGTTTIPAGEEVGASISAELTRYWFLSVNDTRSFANGGATITSGASLTYRDDCIAVVGSIVQNGISVNDVRPGVSVLLTVVFKNLGEVGEKILSD